MARPTITETIQEGGKPARGRVELSLVAAEGAEAFGYAPGDDLSFLGYHSLELVDGVWSVQLNPNSGASADAITSPSGTRWKVTAHLRSMNSNPVVRHLNVPDTAGTLQAQDILATAPAPLPDGGATAAALAAEIANRIAGDLSLTSFFNVKDFGAVGNGVTDDADAINDAILAASAAGVNGEVFLPGGVYKVNSSIRLRPGVLLRGSGSHTASGRPGSMLDGTDLPGTDPVIYSDASDFLHHGGLLRLQARNGPGIGVDISAMGECFVIDQVAAYSNASHGISITGNGTPVHVGRVSVHSNGAAGFFIGGQTETHVQIQYIAGDNNGTALFHVNALDSRSVIRLLGWKSERSTNGTTGHPTVIKITNGNGGYVDLGMGRAQCGAGVALGNEIILNEATTGSVANVAWEAIGLRDYSGTGGYTNVYDDTDNAYTIAKGSDVRWYGFRIGGSTLPMINVRNAVATANLITFDGTALPQVNRANTWSATNTYSGTLRHTGSTAGFFGATAATKPAVTGSRGGNAALASLLTALATLGLITDSTTA